MPSNSKEPSCLVLAAKRVGLACLKVMMQECEDNIRVVLAGSAADVGILSVAREAGVEATVCSKPAFENLCNSSLHFDWLVNLWCPHVLKPKILSLSRRRLNVHPGLVPHCRGNDGAAWALRLQVPAGVSLIEMGPEIDSGGVYAQRRVSYGPSEKGRALHDRLQDAAIALFREEWPRLRYDLSSPPPQRGAGSYFTRKLTESDRIRAGSEKFTLDEVVNWSLAHDFSPGTTAEVRTSDGRALRVKVEELDNN